MVYRQSRIIPLQWAGWAKGAELDVWTNTLFSFSETMTDFNIRSALTPSRTRACNVSLTDASVYLRSISRTEGRLHKKAALLRKEKEMSKAKKDKIKCVGCISLGEQWDRGDLWWFENTSLQRREATAWTSSSMLINWNVNGCLTVEVSL